jgi:hypothetical protein
MKEKDNPNHGNAENVDHLGQSIMLNNVFIANLKIYLFIGTLKLV